MIGGGDSAMEDAIFISKFADDLTVVNRRDEFRASKIMQERAAEQPNIEFRTPYVAEEFVAGEDGKLDQVRLRNVETGEIEDFDADGAFVAIGHIPKSEIVAGPGRHRRGGLHPHRGRLDQDQPGRRLRRRRRRRPHLPPGGHRGRHRLHGRPRRRVVPARHAALARGALAARRRAGRDRPDAGQPSRPASGRRRSAMPSGVSTSTGSPTSASRRARPIGDSAESRPAERSASVEPTRVQVLTLPLPSSSTSAVRPKREAVAGRRRPRRRRRCGAARAAA